MGVWSKFKYLGFDKQTISKCKEIINRDNVKTVRDVSILLIIIVAILLCFYCIFDNSNITRITICGVMTVILFLVYFISKKMLQKEKYCTYFNANLIIYVLLFLCFTTGIYLGTFAAVDEMAVAPVWMFFFAILIFNLFPIQNIVILILSGVTFLICSYILKRPFLFQYDAMHAVTSILASGYVSWVKSKMKVENTMALIKLQKENHDILETVEEQVKETEILRYKVAIDELSGFYKKQSFENIVSRILEHSNDETQHALVCCDIDDFKSINDKFGHMYGDHVLKEIVSSIVDGIGMNCLFGRFGGDEFMIFIENINNTDEILNRVASMQNLCRKEYQENTLNQWVSLSCGIAFYPSEGGQYEDLFNRADEKLYQAKKQKKKGL